MVTHQRIAHRLAYQTILAPRSSAILFPRQLQLFAIYHALRSMTAQFPLQRGPSFEERPHLLREVVPPYDHHNGGYERVRPDSGQKGQYNLLPDFEAAENNSV